MALFFSLTVAALIGLIYGITKKNKPLGVTTAIGLIVIAIILLGYSYLYSKNPY